jgi:Zn-dependent M28 family amino/carboxypeptidase
MALALAETFSETSPRRLRIGFLFSGAEEPGLYGAEAFVKKYGGQQKVALFNLDMVGAGDNLLIVNRVGSMWTRETNKELNTLLFNIWPKAKTVWYSLKSGDFEAFLKGGIDAISIQTTGSDQADVAYHTIHDDMKNVNIQTLEFVGQICGQFTEMLPYTDWAMDTTV